MLFLAKYLGILFEKKIINCLSPQINENSYQSQSLSFMQNIMPMQLVYCFELCQILWPMLETFCTSHDQDHVHVHSHTMLLYWKIASISIHHKIKLQVIPLPPLSPKLPSGMWAIQKEIKDAYPKKVCHMLTRACYKKKDAYPKKVCHMPTRHAKKKREKKIAHIQEK